MKKCFIIILSFLLLIAALAACAAEAPKATAPAPTQTTTPAVTPKPSETPLPDFSGTDFKGNWHVTEVTASDGSAASESEMKEMGADFTLELLKDDVYFVYNAKGKVLGQGRYSVLKNKLALSAGDKETVYEISDENTLRSVAGDGSITTMSRIKEESPEESKEDSDKKDEEDKED